MRAIEDITARRHGGNTESIDANRRAEFGKGYWRARIIAWASSGRRFTIKDLSQAFDRPLNALSGRLSELKRDRVLRPTGERRDGCAVLELVPSMTEVGR